MGQKGLDFKHKEVINIKDGRRLGIIVPGTHKLMSMFSNSNDIVIPWEQIQCIGEEIILVDI